MLYAELSGITPNHISTDSWREVDCSEDEWLGDSEPSEDDDFLRRFRLAAGLLEEADSLLLALSQCESIGAG